MPSNTDQKKAQDHAAQDRPAADTNIPAGSATLATHSPGGDSAAPSSDQDGRYDLSTLTDQVEAIIRHLGLTHLLSEHQQAADQEGQPDDA